MDLEEHLQKEETKSIEITHPTTGKKERICGWEVNLYYNNKSWDTFKCYQGQIKNFENWMAEQDSLKSR